MFSFDLIKQLMIKVWTIMIFLVQEAGGRGSSAGARQRERTRSRRPSSGQGGVKNPEFKRVSRERWGSCLRWFDCQMYSVSRAENLRLRTEIDDLRSDLEAANRHLDIAFHVSGLLFWCCSNQTEPRANNKPLIAGVCQELRIRHREAGEESDGEEARKHSRTNKGLVFAFFFIV